MKTALKPKTTHSNLELLEPRIAPATLLNPQTLSYTEPDGDTVLVKTTKGSWELNDFVFIAVGTPGGEPSLLSIDLRDRTDFAGAKITITASGPGDGHAFVPSILAAGVDLAAVKVDGGLGFVTAGDGDADTPGLGALTAASLGSFFTMQTKIAGKLGKVVIAGEVANCSIEADAIGSVVIGGSLKGSTTEGTGRIAAEKGGIGSVKIGGNLQGGSGDESGAITAVGKIGRVSIGGDLLGGPATASGYIYSLSAIGSVKIAGDLRGGSFATASLVGVSGAILSEDSIGRVSIGKSLIAGTNSGSGELVQSGAICAGTLGSVKIGGGIEGNAKNHALITGIGRAEKPASGQDLAIGSVSVKGNVQYAEILAGFDRYENPLNADASIGKVSVGGHWKASSVVAGAQDTGTAGWGIGDTLQTVGDTSLVARIASITIKGHVEGTSAGGDHFGFVAEQIGKLVVSGKAVALKTGPSNEDVRIGTLTDVRVLEVQ